MKVQDDLESAMQKRQTLENLRIVCPPGQRLSIHCLGDPSRAWSRYRAMVVASSSSSSSSGGRERQPSIVLEAEGQGYKQTLAALFQKSTEEMLLRLAGSEGGRSEEGSGNEEERRRRHQGRVSKRSLEPILEDSDLALGQSSSSSSGGGGGNSSSSEDDGGRLERALMESIADSIDSIHIYGNHSSTSSSSSGLSSLDGQGDAQTGRVRRGKKELLIVDANQLAEVPSLLVRCLTQPSSSPPVDIVSVISSATATATATAPGTENGRIMTAWQQLPAGVGQFGTKKCTQVRLEMRFAECPEGSKGPKSTPDSFT